MNFSLNSNTSKNCKAQRNIHPEKFVNTENLANSFGQCDVKEDSANEDRTSSSNIVDRIEESLGPLSESVSWSRPLAIYSAISSTKKLRKITERQVPAFVTHNWGLRST